MILKLVIVILLIIIIQQHEVDLWGGILNTFDKIRQLQKEIGTLFADIRDANDTLT